MKTKTPLSQYLLLLILSLLSLSASALQVLSSVDRKIIGENETLQLTVRINEQVNYGGPEFDELQEHFIVDKQHRSNQVLSVNGRAEGWTEWTFTLTPKKSGQLLIPSFKYQDVFSEAIPITVSKVVDAASSQSGDMFLEVETDKSSVYVQEQVLLRIRFYTAVSIREYAQTEELKIDQTIIEPANEAVFRKRINDRVYEVKEFTQALYPQQSGKLEIPSIKWAAMVAPPSVTTWNSSPFNRSRGSIVRLQSEPIVVDVKTKPSEFNGDTWLPASSVKLEQHWSSDPSRFKVGEPITRTITVVADGLTAAQLPPLPEQQTTSVKIYADQPQFDNLRHQQGITGHRIESVAIMPTESGNLTLPAVEIPWWDTVNQRQQIARLPEQIISVAASANTNVNNQNNTFDAQANTAPEITGDESTSLFNTRDRWPFSYLALIASNIIFSLLAVGFFIAWIKSRQMQSYPMLSDPSNEQSTKSLNKLFHDIRKACSDNNLQKTRGALARWGKAYWQLPHLASLKEIGQLADTESLSKELAELDKILYGSANQTTWNGKALWRALVDFKQANEKRRGKQANQTDELPSLYPTTH